jgi:hypothetical protein
MQMSNNDGNSTVRGALLEELWEEFNGPLKRAIGKKKKLDKP